MIWVWRCCPRKGFCKTMSLPCTSITAFEAFLAFRVLGPGWFRANDQDSGGFKVPTARGLGSKALAE